MEINILDKSVFNDALDMANFEKSTPDEAVFSSYEIGQILASNCDKNLKLKILGLFI